MLKLDYWFNFGPFLSFPQKKKSWLDVQDLFTGGVLAIMFPKIFQNNQKNIKKKTFGFVSIREQSK
jgi:hypothetical protein